MSSYLIPVHLIAMTKNSKDLSTNFRIDFLSLSLFTFSFQRCSSPHFALCDQLWNLQSAQCRLRLLFDPQLVSSVPNSSTDSFRIKMTPKNWSCSMQAGSCRIWKSHGSDLKSLGPKELRIQVFGICECSITPYIPGDIRESWTCFVWENRDLIASKSDVGVPHNMPDKKQFEDAASRLGISRDSHVVFLDSTGVFSSPRAAFTFKVGCPSPQLLSHFTGFLSFHFSFNFFFPFLFSLALQSWQSFNFRWRFTSLGSREIIIRYQDSISRQPSQYWRKGKEISTNFQWTIVCY